MHGIFWFLLIVGIARWVAGAMIGEEVRTGILQGYAGGLDVIFGVVGGYVGSHLFLMRSAAL